MALEETVLGVPGTGLYYAAGVRGGRLEVRVECETGNGAAVCDRVAAEIASVFGVDAAVAPVDRATALTDLAESYFAAGKMDEAKTQTLAALEIAPSYERAQQLLLKLVGR